MMGNEWVLAVAAVVIVALIKSAIDVVIWMAIRRQVEAGDRERNGLRHDVTQLRDMQLKKVADDLQGHMKQDNKRFDAANGSRREIHKELTDIRTHFVHKKECDEAHNQLLQQMGGFNESVVKLAQVSERTDVALKRTEQLAERLINVNGDVAALTARVEDLKNGQARQA